MWCNHCEYSHAFYTEIVLSCCFGLSCTKLLLTNVRIQEAGVSVSLRLPCNDSKPNAAGLVRNKRFNTSKSRPSHRVSMVSMVPSLIGLIARGNCLIVDFLIERS